MKSYQQYLCTIVASTLLLHSSLSALSFPFLREVWLGLSEALSADGGVEVMVTDTCTACLFLNDHQGLQKALMTSSWSAQRQQSDLPDL